MNRPYRVDPSLELESGHPTKMPSFVPMFCLLYLFVLIGVLGACKWLVSVYTSAREPLLKDKDRDPRKNDVDGH